MSLVGLALNRQFQCHSEAVTTAMREIARDKVGRAEALRRAMLALIDSGDPHTAHPAYWAHFIIVREGAR
jgi:CHAT domain-containing protein